VNPGQWDEPTGSSRCIRTGRATELYRCFLLDRLDALAVMPGIARVVAFTPPEARARMAALAPAGFRLVAQEGDDLTERLTRLFDRLMADGHPAAPAMDSDSPTLPMAYGPTRRARWPPARPTS